MSNPSGDYQFAGLGFIGLRFFQDGSQYVGNLDDEDGFVAISRGTYTDATGVFTFSAAESPAGLVDSRLLIWRVLRRTETKTGSCSASASRLRNASAS